MTEVLPEPEGTDADLRPAGKFLGRWTSAASHRMRMFRDLALRATANGVDVLAAGIECQRGQRRSCQGEQADSPQAGGASADRLRISSAPAPRHAVHEDIDEGFRAVA